MLWYSTQILCNCIRVQLIYYYLLCLALYLSLAVPTPKPMLPIIALCNLIVIFRLFEGWLSYGTARARYSTRQWFSGTPIFIDIGEGIQANKALTPLITDCTPSHAFFPRIRIVRLIVVFISSFHFHFQPSAVSPFLYLKMRPMRPVLPQ